MNKKGNFIGMSIGMVVLFGIIAITVGLTMFTLGSIKDTQTANSTEWNSTTDVIEGFEIFSSLLPGAGVVVGVLILLMLIVFGFRNLIK